MPWASFSRLDGPGGIGLILRRNSLDHDVIGGQMAQVKGIGKNKNNTAPV